jgi:hypothetical protein
MQFTHSIASVISEIQHQAELPAFFRAGHLPLFDVEMGHRAGTTKPMFAPWMKSAACARLTWHHARTKKESKTRMARPKVLTLSP